MPIIDVRLVLDAASEPPPRLAASLAAELGRLLNVEPGRLWVRLEVLPASNYAENDAPVATEDLPVFVTVLHAHLPAASALATQAGSIAALVAAALHRPRSNVHVEYAPAGAGRIAFGGKLVG